MPCGAASRPGCIRAYTLLQDIALITSPQATRSYARQATWVTEHHNMASRRALNARRKLHCSGMVQDMFANASPDLRVPLKMIALGRTCRGCGSHDHLVSSNSLSSLQQPLPDRQILTFQLTCRGQADRLTSCACAKPPACCPVRFHVLVMPSTGIPLIGVPIMTMSWTRSSLGWTRRR